MTKRRIFKPILPAMPSITGAYDAMSASGMLDCRDTSTLTGFRRGEIIQLAPPIVTIEEAKAESYAEKYPNDRWDLFEALPRFRAWACDPIVHTNGSRYRYAVVSRTPFPGLGWVLLYYCIPLPNKLPEMSEESQGAFYDGDDRHPEGAIEWAKTAARAMKVRNFDSADWNERKARVWEKHKHSAPPPGDPGVLDAKWKEILISLGYSEEEAHRLSLRPTPRPLSPELPGKLAAIKVLWRMPYTLALYGIPYLMREGQSPNDLRRAHDEFVEPPPGSYGSKRIDLSDWIWLGSPGWWGSYSRADFNAIKAWLELPHVVGNIPDRGGEFCTIDEPSTKEGTP